MRSRLSFFLTAVLLSAGPSAALAMSNQPIPQFTIQVASFPDTALAERFAAQLVNAGERPVFDTVAIDGLGHWTRVFVGFFDTSDAARRYGDSLIGRGIIREFLVKRAQFIQAVTRPRRVTGGTFQTASRSASPPVSAVSGAATPVTRTVFNSPYDSRPAAGGRTEPMPVKSKIAAREVVSAPLPVIAPAALRLAPRVDTSRIPRPDPVGLAYRLVTGETRNGGGAPDQRGGLWISGDSVEGLARLRWIVGDKNAGLIELEADGRVKLDSQLLAGAAGLGEGRVEDPLRAVDYISSNEGLLLLVQVAQGRYRYLLHIGHQAPTSGKSVATVGSINLDNNVDSRINPYRKDGRKLDAERPPEGFDSLIGLNPVARWFNLSTNCWVQGGEIVFHELAEAYAKLELGLDYLDHGLRPGAHAFALEREGRLKSQRPGADIVMTTGSNRLLRTEEEIRLFYAEAAGGSNQR